MALIEFKDYPDTSTPLSADNLNNNFEELNENIEDIVDKFNVEMGEVLQTNQIVDGKPVFVKKIDTGTVPSNSVTITSTGLTDINIIKADWFMYNSGGVVACLPYANPSAPAWAFFSDVNGACKAHIATDHSNLEGWESYLILYFTYND